MIDKKTLIKFGGIAAIVGSINAVIADILGIMVYKDHNPIKQTISQLAHGKYAYIQDAGLTCFGLGILAVSIALYAWKSNSKTWVTGILLLALMGICTIILAELNQFAGEPGTTVHIVLAVSIGILFSVCTFLLGNGLKNASENWHKVSIGIGIVFLVACSGFLLIPENYEGLYERGIALLVVLWFITLGYNLYKIGKLL